MANLSTNASLRFLGDVYTQKYIMDTSGAQTSYKGEPFVIDQNVDTVYVHTAKSLTLADGDVFMGIAAESVSVTASATENTNLTLYVEPTIVGFVSAVFDDADSGKTVYMSDTGTLSESNGTYPQIGKLTKVADGYAFVQLETPKVLDVP